MYDAEGLYYGYWLLGDRKLRLSAGLMRNNAGVIVCDCCDCCRHWFLVFTGCVFVMCVMGDIFGGYMLHYIAWDWLIAIGMFVVVVFTIISGVVFLYTVCLSFSIIYFYHFLSYFTQELFC